LTTESGALRTIISQALAAHQGGTETVLSSLLAVRDAIGYIPQVALEEVAHLMHTTVNDVWGVASFYPNFRFDPPAKHAVEVCWGTSCHLGGAAPVLKEVMDALGMESEGDTQDGSITFKFNTCLGACAQAPVISLDHHMLGKVTPYTAREHVIRLRDGIKEAAS
jgi:NADH-quinone oxidoreductase subunit E